MFIFYVVNRYMSKPQDWLDCGSDWFPFGWIWVPHSLALWISGWIWRVWWAKDRLRRCFLAIHAVFGPGGLELQLFGLQDQTKNGSFGMPTLCWTHLFDLQSRNLTVPSRFYYLPMCCKLGCAPPLLTGWLLTIFLQVKTYLLGLYLHLLTMIKPFQSSPKRASQNAQLSHSSLRLRCSSRIPGWMSPWITWLHMMGAEGFNIRSFLLYHRSCWITQLLSLVVPLLWSKEDSKHSCSKEAS